MPLSKANQSALQMAIAAEIADRIVADTALSTALDQLTQRVNNLSSSSQLAASRDYTKINPLTYSTSNSASYSYYASYTMALLGDGNVNAGMMAYSPPVQGGQTEGRVFVHMTMPSDSFINVIDLWCGQFNGPYNFPTKFEIYRGFVTDTSTFRLYTSPLAPNSNQQTFDLTNIAGLNSPLKLITIALIYAVPGSGTVSINEIGLRGYAA